MYNGINNWLPSHMQHAHTLHAYKLTTVFLCWRSTFFSNPTGSALTQNAFFFGHEGYNGMMTLLPSTSISWLTSRYLRHTEFFYITQYRSIIIICSVITSINYITHLVMSRYTLRSDSSYRIKRRNAMCFRIPWCSIDWNVVCLWNITLYIIQ